MPRPKKPEEELRVEWSKMEGDFVVHYPSKPTGGYIMNFLFGKRLGTRVSNDDGLEVRFRADWNKNILVVEEKTLIQELEERGYDITTIKFSVKKKKEKAQKD